jgi:hypothetical protein
MFKVAFSVALVAEMMLSKVAIKSSRSRVDLLSIGRKGKVKLTEDSVLVCNVNIWCLSQFFYAFISTYESK